MIAAVVALAVGGGAGYVLRKNVAEGKLATAEEKASRMIKEAEEAIEAKKKGLGFICPQQQGNEALWAELSDIIAAPNLISLLNHLKGEILLPQPQQTLITEPNYFQDLSDIKGQETFWGAIVLYNVCLLLLLSQALQFIVYLLHALCC